MQPYRKRVVCVSLLFFLYRVRFYWFYILCSIRYKYRSDCTTLTRTYDARLLQHTGVNTNRGRRRDNIEGPIARG